MVTLPQVAVFAAMSLDGYIARPDHSLDWLKPYEGEEHGYKAFFASIDALLIGRNTYNVVLSFPDWPYANTRCVVLTHHPVKPRRSEEFYDGPVRPIVERLGKEGVKRIYADGGMVVRECLKERLVTEITISIIPVMLGAGIPMFASLGAERGLRLVGSQALPSGVVQLRYTPS